MKLTLEEVKKYLPALKWDAAELAQKLSLIGHETEVSTEGRLNITIAANRKDCQDPRYLLFDLNAIYPETGLLAEPITFSHTEKILAAPTFINHFLGTAFSKDEIDQIARLGFKVEADGYSPPDFRSDVSEPADVCEEAIRLIGYDKLIPVELSKEGHKPSLAYQKTISLKSLLKQAGWTETLTYSFTATGQIRLQNPASAAEPFLRDSLLPGLLKTLARNPYLKRCQFFELGEVFRPAEETHLGLVLAGYKDPQPIIDELTQKLGLTLRFKSVEPELLAKYDVKQSRVTAAEISLAEVKELAPVGLADELKPIKPISKYPPLVREVTIPHASPYFDAQQFAEIVQAKFPNLLLAEVIYEYTSGDRQTRTYRLILQKFDSSFTETEIKELDGQLEKLFFQA